MSGTASLMVWLSWQLVVSTGRLQLFRLRANLFRTQSGQGHSAQGAKPKVILIALTNTTLDKSHYIFTDSWVVAMAWLFGLSLGKPQTVRFKTTPFGTETNWNQAAGWVCTARLQVLLTWTIIRPDRVTHQPLCWVQGKTASVFDTQATTTCQTFWVLTKADPVVWQWRQPHSRGYCPYLFLTHWLHLTFHLFLGL